MSHYEEQRAEFEKACSAFKPLPRAQQATTAVGVATVADLKKLTPAMLDDLIIQLTGEIESIQAQLEFISEDQTDEWEKRAVAALAAKRSTRGMAQKVLNRKLRGPDAEKRGAQIHAQIIRGQAAKQERMLKHEEIRAIEAQRKLEASRENSRRERLNSIRRAQQQRRMISENAFACKFALELLTPGQRADVLERARIASEQAVRILNAPAVVSGGEVGK